MNDNEPDKNEIVTAEREEAQLPDMYENAESRAKIVNTLIPALLKCCHEKDITDFGGKPFVGDSGCEKIARVAGISFSRPEVKSGFEEDDDGKRVYTVTIRGEATIMGQTVFEVGGCDDNDKFIAARKLGLIQRKLEVEKKAYCNWRGRCVRTLLGLSGLTWNDLKKQGVTQEGRTKVTFSEGKNASDVKGGTTEEKCEEVKTKIRDQVLKDCSGNVDAAAEALLKITSFKGQDGKEHDGVKSVNDKRFTEKWAFRTWAGIKPDGKERERYNEIIVEIEAKQSDKALADKDASTKAPELY